MTIWLLWEQLSLIAMNVNLQRLSPAERLLWNYGVTEPGHIDLEAIAFAHGAEVIYRPLGGCEARLVARGDSAIISISSGGNGGHQRFSLAHELAHWINDRTTGSFLCAKEDIGPQNFGAKLVEAKANDFGSQLILPNYLVDPWMKGRTTTLDTASLLCAEFTTSLTAAAIRLIKRTNDPACVTCHNQTRLIWHQRSSRCPSDFYLVSELHPETDGFRMAFGGESGLSRPKIEPAHYWVSSRSASRLEATTQSVRLPDGTVLTMIAFP